MHKLIGLMGMVSLMGCPNINNGNTPEPRDTEWCEAAGKQLEILQCKDRAGNPIWVNKKGERFVDMCKIAQEEGMVFLNPRCVAEATSCEKANQCPPSSE